MNRYFTIFYALLFSTSVLADPIKVPDQTCDPSSQDACSVYLDQGQTAPFEGILMTPAMAGRIDVFIREATAHLDIASETCAKRLQVQTEAQRRTIETLRTSAKTREEILLQAVEQANRQKEQAEVANTGTVILTGTIAGSIGIVVGAALLTVGIYATTSR